MAAESACIIVKSRSDVQQIFHDCALQGDSVGALGVVQALWAVCDSAEEFEDARRAVYEDLEGFRELPEDLAADLRRQLSETLSYQEGLLAFA